MEVHLVPRSVGSCKKQKKKRQRKDDLQPANRSANNKWTNHSAEESEAYAHPPTGTMASEWSELFMWKPRMYFEVETIAKDSNCSQRVPSWDGWKPVVQAQVLLPGLGRQRWGQPPLFSLQALVVPAESEGGGLGDGDEKSFIVL